MTTWTSISNAAVAVGGIPSSTTVTALRDNPSALAESASGAPVMVSGWHPHDKVSIGDGKTGLIYDFAVNGVQSSVVTPDFVDGYEYRIVAHSMNSSVTSSSVRLNLEGFFEIDASYRRLAYTASELGDNDFGYDAEILMPRIATRTHLVQGEGYSDSNIGFAIDSTSYDSTLQKVLRARVIFTSGNITAGKIWFFRRREYASSP